MFEVMLINFVNGEILDEVVLFLCFVVYIQCFWFEVGSVGCDILGMLCQYQFEKVEMVLIVYFDVFEDEYECMIGCVEVILIVFDLLFCMMKLCLGDMGVGMKCIYDFEVWLFGQGKYCEILLVLVVGDYQVCCMNVCFKLFEGGKLQFVYMLNGLGLVVGCVLIVVLENGQNVDGLVILLIVLYFYFGGKIIFMVDGIFV